MSEQFCEKIEILRKNLYFKRCCIQVVFRVTLLWNKCYFWLCYFQLAVFLCLLNLCFLYVGVFWIFNWNVNSSKFFTDIDQFYDFIHFSFFTSISRLYQNTGPKTVQTNNNWYLQKGKKFQIISKVYFFVRKLNVKNSDYAAILIFFLAQYNYLKKMWSGYISFLTDKIGSCGWKSPRRKNYVERNVFFCRKQSSFAHNRNCKRTNCWFQKHFAIFLQVYFKTC